MRRSKVKAGEREKLQFAIFLKPRLYRLRHMCAVVKLFKTVFTHIGRDPAKDKVGR